MDADCGRRGFGTCSIRAAAALVIATAAFLATDPSALAQSSDCDQASYAERIVLECQPQSYAAADPVPDPTPDPSEDPVPDPTPDPSEDPVEAPETNDSTAQVIESGSTVTNADDSSSALPVITGLIGATAVGSVLFIGVKRSDRASSKL